MTRLYLTNEAAGYTPASWKFAWENTTSAVTKKLGAAKAGALTTVAVSETSTSAMYDLACGRFVSDALAAPVDFTAGVTRITSCAVMTESAAAANMKLEWHLWVSIGDSDTVRGTLASGRLEGELPVTLTGRPSGGWLAVSTFSAQAGDRYILELGCRAANTGATQYTATLEYGGSGTDATEGSASGTAGWLDIADIEVSCGGSLPSYPYAWQSARNGWWLRNLSLGEYAGSDVNWDNHEIRWPTGKWVGVELICQGTPATGDNFAYYFVEGGVPAGGFVKATLYAQPDWTLDKWLLECGSEQVELDPIVGERFFLFAGKEADNYRWAAILDAYGAVMACVSSPDGVSSSEYVYLEQNILDADQAGANPDTGGGTGFLTGVVFDETGIMYQPDPVLGAEYGWDNEAVDEVGNIYDLVGPPPLTPEKVRHIWLCDRLTGARRLLRNPR